MKKKKNFTKQKRGSEKSSAALKSDFLMFYLNFLFDATKTVQKWEKFPRNLSASALSRHHTSLTSRIISDFGFPHIETHGNPS